MTLSEISAKILEKLTTEAGTNEFWDETVIKSDINYLYRDCAETLENIKTRDSATDSIDGTARYVIPITAPVATILRVLKVEYNGEKIDAYSTDELDAINYKWRSLGDGTPWGWFFESGDENVAISLVPAPAEDDVEIAMTFAYKPAELTDGDTPVYPYADGSILIDGVISMELAKPGGGRDLDRSDWYFSQFNSHFVGLNKHKLPITRGFKSIEESGSDTRGVRLLSNYPKYEF